MISKAGLRLTFYLDSRNYPSDFSDRLNTAARHFGFVGIEKHPTIFQLIEQFFNQLSFRWWRRPRHPYKRCRDASKAGRKFLGSTLTQATNPKGFSTSSLNTFISIAPSAPSIARWSNDPVADITVAMASSTT